MKRIICTKDIKTSVYYSAVIYIAMFFVMLMFNIFTPLVADDYSFNFSALNGERITSFSQIFPALTGHAKFSNGRIVPHFFVYLMILLPKNIFNFVNSLMYVTSIYLIYKVCKGHESNNNYILLGIMGCIWVFEPVFGQINLWIAGSCNYLWAFVFGMLFIIPFVNTYIYGEKIRGSKAFFHILISFLAGAFSENGSAAFIFIACLILFFIKFEQKNKVSIYYILSVFLSFLGYISIFLLSPGEIKNKGAEFSFQTLRKNFIDALNVYSGFCILLVVFIALFVIAIVKKVKRECIVVSLCFILGSLASNFIMLFAAYYPSRSSVFSFLMIVIADALLMHKLFDSEYKVWITIMILILSMFFVYNVVIGADDAYKVHLQCTQNEEFIFECKEKGYKNITVPLFEKYTPYNAFVGLPYLSNETPWINKAMARYYEVDSIIGEWT